VGQLPTAAAPSCGNLVPVAGFGRFRDKKKCKNTEKGYQLAYNLKLFSVQKFSIKGKRLKK
jgi:hypothetical protein